MESMRSLPHERTWIPLLAVAVAVVLAGDIAALVTNTGGNDARSTRSSSLVSPEDAVAAPQQGVQTASEPAPAGSRSGARPTKAPAGMTPVSVANDADRNPQPPDVSAFRPPAAGRYRYSYEYSSAHGSLRGDFKDEVLYEIRTEGVEGTTTRQVHTRRENKRSFIETFSWRPDGLWWQAQSYRTNEFIGNMDCDMVPHAQLLRFPLREGDEWSATFECVHRPSSNQDGSVRYRMTSLVGRDEAVSIGGRRITATRVASVTLEEQENRESSAEIRRDFLYAAELGLVVEDVVEQNYDLSGRGSGTRRDEWRLLSLDRG